MDKVVDWTRNCFRYGTLGEYWKQTESENWYDPSFQEFVNKELIPWTQKIMEVRFPNQI
jgi:hypothetical protein